VGPDLATVAQVAHRHDVPVIVDAANQVPPMLNLRRFVAEGADLVAMSGGKAFRGPQSSGLLCGRRDLVAAALLQQVDMDVAPASWTPPKEFVDKPLNGVPRHGFGRGFKVGKEEIAGAVAALDAPVVGQLGAFAGASGLLWWLIRPLERAHRRQPALPTGTAALTGRKALVTTEVTAHGGRVKLGGESWAARTLTPGLVLAPGTHVAVAEVDGATLVVFPEEI
jgi:membrane protein implicated in regulation of membrane protease activity